MRRATLAGNATYGLPAVAAPAIAGAAQQPGKPLSVRVPALLPSEDWLTGAKSAAPHKGMARNRSSRDKAMTLTNSTTAALIGLPQQDRKAMKQSTRVGAHRQAYFLLAAPMSVAVAVKL